MKDRIYLPFVKMASTSFLVVNIRYLNFYRNQILQKSQLLSSRIGSTYSQESMISTVPEFKRLELITKIERRGRGRFKKGQAKTEAFPPRFKEMPVDQSWMSVWPTAQSFRPSVVPLPIRQGWTKKEAPPGKFANAELMKIPNFLHLTPPAIEAHCVALKKFCTPWPEGLDSDEACEKHFPLEIITSDYCWSSPSIRDPKARIVTIKFKLADLKLDYHGRDKFIRLVGNRYNHENDVVTILADRCPLRKQNYDYAIYVMTALYHESQKTEDWESEKTEDDMEAYFWEKSRSQKKLYSLVQVLKGIPLEEVEKVEFVQSYGKVTEDLYNSGESRENLNKYKNTTLGILGLTISA